MEREIYNILLHLSAIFITKMILELDVTIRQETKDDYKAVFDVVEAAFRGMPLSDQTEQFLVERLRKSEGFIPQLSLVAEVDDMIVGHIMITKVFVKRKDQEMESLCLAPVSVHPDFQKSGIGGQLVETAHFVAMEMGFSAIVLVGHPEYYPRFGYVLASKYGIQFPIEAPDEACMAVALVPGGLDDLKGTVQFPREFF